MPIHYGDGKIQSLPSRILNIKNVTGSKTVTGYSEAGMFERYNREDYFLREKVFEVTLPRVKSKTKYHIHVKGNVRCEFPKYGQRVSLEVCIKYTDRPVYGSSTGSWRDVNSYSLPGIRSPQNVNGNIIYDGFYLIDNGTWDIPFRGGAFGDAPIDIGYDDYPVDFYTTLTVDSSTNEWSYLKPSPSSSYQTGIIFGLKLVREIADDSESLRDSTLDTFEYDLTNFEAEISRSVHFGGNQNPIQNSGGPKLFDNLPGSLTVIEEDISSSGASWTLSPSNNEFPEGYDGYSSSSPGSEMGWGYPNYYWKDVNTSSPTMWSDGIICLVPEPLDKFRADGVSRSDTDDNGNLRFDNTGTGWIAMFGRGPNWEDNMAYNKGTTGQAPGTGGFSWDPTPEPSPVGRIDYLVTADMGSYKEPALGSSGTGHPLNNDTLSMNNYNTSQWTKWFYESANHSMSIADTQVDIHDFAFNGKPIFPRYYSNDTDTSRTWDERAQWMVVGNSYRTNNTTDNQTFNSSGTLDEYDLPSNYIVWRTTGSSNYPMTNWISGEIPRDTTRGQIRDQTLCSITWCSIPRGAMMVINSTIYFFTDDNHGCFIVGNNIGDINRSLNPTLVAGSDDNANEFRDSWEGWKTCTQLKRKINSMTSNNGGYEVVAASHGRISYSANYGTDWEEAECSNFQNIRETANDTIDGITDSIFDDIFYDVIYVDKTITVNGVDKGPGVWIATGAHLLTEEYGSTQGDWHDRGLLAYSTNGRHWTYIDVQNETNLPGTYTTDKNTNTIPVREKIKYIEVDGDGYLMTWVNVGDTNDSDWDSSGASLWVSEMNLTEWNQVPGIGNPFIGDTGIGKPNVFYSNKADLYFNGRYFVGSTAGAVYDNAGGRLAYFELDDYLKIVMETT